MAGIEHDWEENEPAIMPVSKSNGTIARTYRGNSDRACTRNINKGSHDSNGRYLREASYHENGHGDADRNFQARKVMVIPSNKVGRVIGKGGGKIKDIQFETRTQIKVGKSNGPNTEVNLIGAPEAIAKAHTMIYKLLEDFKPLPPKEHNNASATSTLTENFCKLNDQGVEVLDWEKLNSYSIKAQKERYEKLPPIIKDFYKEDTAISKMSSAEVAKWRQNNHDIQVKRTFDNELDLRPIPNPVLTFEQAFQHYPEILKQIYNQGFKQPSPIQSQAWPILLRGDDMIGIAQTGTGKTLAFLLPALIHIEGQVIPREKREGPTVLIMAPTRELALQIHKEVSKYHYKDIKSVCLYGGGNRKEQIKAVSQDIDIVIATPGRLNDLVRAEHVNVINFSYIVLDEADRMLDMGFEPQIRVSLFDVRPDRQTVMTSATWPSGVRRLAESYMKNPIQVNVGSLDLAAVHTVTQKFLFVEENDKECSLFTFLMNMNKNDRVLIFCGKKATARHISTELCIRGIECQSLHSDRDQSDREDALNDMINGTVNILVATDVASRGIDIEDLTHVVNFDFPRQIEEYVHRVGRTGRAGKTGIALSFITKYDWANAHDLIKILEEAYQEVPHELQSMAKRFEAMKLRKQGQESEKGRRNRW